MAHHFANYCKNKKGVDLIEEVNFAENVTLIKNIKLNINKEFNKMFKKTL